jgi:hypothetical protein
MSCRTTRVGRVQEHHSMATTGRPKSPCLQALCRVQPASCPVPPRAGVVDDVPGQYSVQKLNMALARARLE